MKPLTLRVAILMCSLLPAGLAIAGEESVQLSAAPGRDLVIARCSSCHSLDYVEMNAPVLDRGGWEKSVRKMIDRFAAPIAQDDAQRILEYLAANY